MSLYIENNYAQGMMMTPSVRQGFPLACFRFCSVDDANAPLKNFNMLVEQHDDAGAVMQDQSIRLRVTTESKPMMGGRGNGSIIIVYLPIISYPAGDH